MGFYICLHGDDTPTAQAGATSRHGLICGNIQAALHRPAKTSDCRLYQSDMKVLISQFSSVRYYPHLVLTCGPVDDAATSLDSRCLITEVLSPSTRDLDRREKLLAYTTLHSLQGYLLVDTAMRAARLYTRAGERWNEHYLEDTGTPALPCVDVLLSLNETSTAA